MLFLNKSFMFHISIFFRKQKFLLLQKVPTGFILSQISTFPSLEQRPCITGFSPVCLSAVLRTEGLSSSLGGLNSIFMSSQPQDFSLPNLFFHLLQAINLSLPLALIYNTQEHNPIMNLPWECCSGMRKEPLLVLFLGQKT